MSESQSAEAPWPFENFGLPRHQTEVERVLARFHSWPPGVELLSPAEGELEMSIGVDKFQLVTPC
jgi:hypothetical protein